MDIHPRRPHARWFDRRLAVVTLAAIACALTARATEGSAPSSFFDGISEQARAMAGKPFRPPEREQVPQKLKDLNYSQYRDIRFRKDEALWSGHSLFNIEFFHLGFLYREPVVIHEVVEGEVRTVSYQPAQFDFGKNEGLQQLAGPDLGFAGFRVHYPINNTEYKDELLVFLGASYFRMVGRGQSYGLSARGIAVDTASAKGEEFPRFTEFWLERPGPDESSLVFYALLDSKSVTGAYRFELQPRGDTVLNVQSRVFAREDIDKLGVAPLTSMFLYGSNRVRHFDDHRPQVHDSDGLLMHTGAGEWIWRPLSNPPELSVNSLMDQGIQGFGLLQREREFGQYLDMEARYDVRPSFWVTPHGDWGKGALQLVEIPTPDETNDNIVAFWVPDEPFKAGQERSFDYQVRASGSELTPAHLATVRRTRIGWGAIPGARNKPPRSLRQFTVDFQGGELETLDESQPMEAKLDSSSGEVMDLIVQRLPQGHGWRVAFKLRPEQGQPADMRMFLVLRGQRLSETWNYVWRPDALP
jgi:periplasmic glucans biosynthesis protein